MEITPSVLRRIVTEGVSLALSGLLDEFEMNMDAVQEAVYDELLETSSNKLFTDRKSTRLNSSHVSESRMPSSA